MKRLIILALLCTCHFAVGDFDLRDLQIPDVDIDYFAAKCEKQGGSGSYDKLKTSKENLQTCMTQFANFSVVKDELEEAKKTGSMDEIFGKYCAKRPELASCVRNFTKDLRPCWNADENKDLNVTLDFLTPLGDFICFKDGDRIALFIAERGVECIQNHTEGIKNCVNSTFKIQNFKSQVNINSLSNLLKDKKKCDDLGKLQNCVVEELEKCRDSTPANIVDALFKFIKRSACANKHKQIPKKKCEKQVGWGSYDELGASQENLQTCVTQFVNISAFETELEEAKKTDSMEEVFMKYCAKRATLVSCVENLTNSHRPCLNADENNALNITLNTLTQFADFVCGKDGDRIALFIAEGVVECTQNHTEGIKNCFNSTFKIQPNQANTNSIRNLLMDEKKCDNLGELQNCVVEELKTCLGGTPANLVGALFAFIKRSACANKNKQIPKKECEK